MVPVSVSRVVPVIVMREAGFGVTSKAVVPSEPRRRTDVRADAKSKNSSGA